MCYPGRGSSSHYTPTHALLDFPGGLPLSAFPLRVHEIADSRHPIVDPGTSIGDARKLFLDYGVRILPVVEERTARLAGVVYRGSLLQLTSARLYSNPVKTIASEPRVTASVNDILEPVVKWMLRVDEWYAPVIDDDRRYEAVLGLEHVVAYMLSSRRYDHVLEEPVAKHMSKSPLALRPDDPVYRAWQLMLSKRIAALPVVREDNVLVGVVAEYDLLEKGFTRPRLESDSPTRGPRVRDVMRTPAVAVTPNDPVRRPAELIVKRGIGRVYVVDEDKKLLGVIDREDIVRAALS